MKKIILLLFSILLLTGCSSYTELNDLGIVNLLGIDYKDNNFEVFVKVLEGKQEDDTNSKKQSYYYGKAKNLEEAFQQITIQSNKKIYLSHVDCLILTDDLINRKLKETIDNFLNDNESRNNFNIVLSNDLKVYFNNDVTSDDINKLIEINNKESGTISPIDFEVFLKNLLIDTNSYLPTIIYKNDNLKVDGFTLIKNHRVYKKLDNNESILFNLMNNKIHHTTYKETTIYENETVIKTEQNKVTMIFNITTDGDQKFENELKENCKNLFIYYQNKNYDLLKLSTRIKQNDYFYYKKAKDLLSKIELKIKINVKHRNNYVEGV